MSGNSADAASLAIVWFRRDLRLHDHPALAGACAAYERVVPVFVFDAALVHGRFASTSRTQFMLGALRELERGLCERGSALVVRHGEPSAELTELARSTGASAVFWTSDVSPYARTRDSRVTEALRDAGVEARPHGGGYIVDVSKPRTKQGEPFRVFSPFFRHWRELPRTQLEPSPRLPPLPEGLELGRVPRAVTELGLDPLGTTSEPIVPPGEPAARQALDAWLDQPIADYADRQNGMARIGTSQLSPYLRWGCISARECERRARDRGGSGAEAWVRQLCWREFYAHVLLMWPGNARHEFQERFRDLEWDDPGPHLEAWQRGETGYPAVDAGMRQLAATGWMHNRARLIVGSFLTKDLHLDWREGERWFERLLLDGEPAQNNGNWQWIASVGVDPAPPSRRMYNPTLQGRRFDPEGRYIRRWLPELREVPDDRCFEPWTMSESEQRAAGCRLGQHYPAPIVDHAAERRRALERYGSVSAQSPRASGAKGPPTRAARPGRP